MGKERVNQIQKVQSSIQDKPKEKHIQTHSNQVSSDYTQRILKTLREKQQEIYRGKYMWLTAYLSAETLQARKNWM